MRTGERGSAAVEAAVGVPAFLLFVGLIIFAGRMALAHNAIDAAAAEAARTASIARDSGEASAEARAAAMSTLRNQNVHCRSSNVHVDTSGFAAPLGTGAHVTASVTCLVNLSDLSVPGVPGAKRVRSTATSPIDTYRGR